MEPAEDADITPFWDELCRSAPPPVLQLGWGMWLDHQFDKLRMWHPAGCHLRAIAVAAANARSVQLTRQVLRTAGPPHPCGIYGWMRPGRMRYSTALGRRSLIRMRSQVQVLAGPPHSI